MNEMAQVRLNELNTQGRGMEMNTAESYVVESDVWQDCRGAQHPHSPPHLSLFGAILGPTNVAAMLRAEWVSGH